MEIDRIREVFDREAGFSRRIFTSVELNYCLGKESRYMHLAARFAAKEAVAKALGRSFSWHDVEVVNNADGKPTVNLYGEAKLAAGSARVHLSISHTHEHATAVAVLEGLE
ncbi:MAG: holo-ACP synthase [Armatimonadetes bacterium]|nr:holo-ACP synthase [Armatimonadota bacterium]